MYIQGITSEDIHHHSYLTFIIYLVAIVVRFLNRKQLCTGVAMLRTDAKIQSGNDFLLPFFSIT